MPYKDMKDRNFKKEYENYQGTPEQKKRRALRNAARNKLLKAGKVHKGDGKDVDHVTPLSKGVAMPRAMCVSSVPTRTAAISGIKTTQ